jgi:predicted negative regulator of RcsB-dependent stress response
MAKKKITRKELLKKDDEFISLSARAFQYLAAHLQQIKRIGYGVMIILIIIIGIAFYYRYLNKKALAAYNEAYASLASDASGELSEEAAGKAIVGFEELIEKYGSTKMATLAIPQLASLKFGQGKYDEAISLYQTYLEKEEPGSLYHLMAYFGLAAAYEAKGEYQSAIENLEKIVEGENSFLQEEALFSLGRVYALSGQQDKAQKTFTEFVNRFKESSLFPLAKAQLK